MSSIFEEAFAKAQQREFEVFGVPAEYGQPGHAMQEITVCVQEYDTTIEQSPEVWVAAATIDVRSADVSEPKRGDIVVLDGTTYRVGEIVSRDGLGATLALTKQMVRV